MPAVDLDALADEPFLVAWVDDAGLWLYEQGATAARRLAAGGGYRKPLLDPDRRAIAWQVVDPALPDDPAGWSLWAILLDGQPGDARRILTPADMPEARGWDGLPCPRWLRDIRWLGGEEPVLVFATSAVGECGGNPQRDLWTMSVDGPQPNSPRLDQSQARRLLEKEVAHFQPSPEGEIIAIAEPGDYYGEPPESAWISVLDRNGGLPRRLLSYTQIDTGSDHFMYPDLLWVDAGDALLVAIEPTEAGDRYLSGPWNSSEPVPVIRLGLDGSRTHFGTISGAGMLRRWAAWPNDLMRNPFVIRTPAWSANLAHLAVLDQPETAPSVEAERTDSDLLVASGRLLLAAGDGSGAEPYVTLDNPAFVAWAPVESRYLYAVVQAPGQAHELFVGEPGREPLTIYASPSAGEHAAWAGWAGDALDPAEPLPPLPGTGWEETTVLAAAMAEDPAAFLRGVMATDLVLAGGAAAQPELRPRLPEALLDELRWA